jgi:nicotinamide-nucleotide amidase
MPIVELIAIGTELLLGEIQDTNTQYLARTLRDYGIDIYRSTLIGDNTDRIAEVIIEAYLRSDIVITTGGLGPTIDDPTREAAAKAAGVELEFRPDLWEQIQTRFKRYGREATENNRRQAQIPKGAIPIENEVGTAPAFIIEIEKKAIICLPGVPREMEHILLKKVIPYLESHFNLFSKIVARVLHTAGIGESQIDEWIGDLEAYSNPTVGLLAHPGQVDIRITAKADSVEEANRMISQIEAIINDRVGNSIYGYDEDTPEGTLIQLLSDKGWTQSIVEGGLDGVFISRVEKVLKKPISQKVTSKPIGLDKLIEIMKNLQMKGESNCYFGVSLMQDIEIYNLFLVAISPQGMKATTRLYGGPPSNAPLWAVNLAFDFFRKSIIT